MALTDNALAYYKLDESSGNASDSVGSNTLTNANVTYGSGLINNCAQFGSTNTNKRLYVASNLGVTTSGDWTISYWVRNSAVNVIFGMMELIYGGGTKKVVCFYDGANTRWYVGTVAGTTTPSHTISANTWYHVCLVNSSGTITLYVDGVSKGTISSASTTSGLSEAFELGHATVALGGYWAPGDADETYVCGSALTSDEVTSLYNSGAGNQYPFASGFVPRIMGIV